MLPLGDTNPVHVPTKMILYPDHIGESGKRNVMYVTKGQLALTPNFPC